MEEHHRRLHVKAERASVIGGDIVDGAFGSWALRAARSEHQLKQQSNEDLAQNARISALLGEMRPRMSAMPPNGHQQQYQPQLRRKANTTNIVDVSSQVPSARNAIYGSWQDRHRPTRLYGSQLVSSSSTLPKYDQLYCNTASPLTGNGSTNTIATTGIRREPPEYGNVGRSVSTWQVTNSEHRPSLQAGWLKSSRPLARGALSPAAYFRDLENRHGSGASSPIVGGLSVVAVPITQRHAPTAGLAPISDDISTSKVSLDTENQQLNNEDSDKISGSALSRNTPRQASFMAAMQRHPLKESTSIESNGGGTNTEEDQTVSATSKEDPSEDTGHDDPEETQEISETPIRRSRNRNASLRNRQSSRSLGGLDFEKLRMGTARVGDSNEATAENGTSSSSSRKNSRDDGLTSSPTTVAGPVFTTSSTSSISTSGEASSTAVAAAAAGSVAATTSRQTSSNSSVDSNHNEAMKMIRRARPKSYVLATSASMNEDVLSSSIIANEQSSSISHDTTTSGRELPSSLMGSTISMEMRSGGASSATTTTTSNSGQQTSRSLNAPHPPATHRLQRFIALFNSSKTSDGSGEHKKSRMKRSRTSLPASRFALPGTILQRDGVARQTWVKHQEIALGKSGKRNNWEDRWAVLCRRSLYLCVESPAYTTEKTIELGSHTRVDVCNAIVDIAYDWLSSSFSKQRHVVRIVTQNRSEHLIELNTESEMLSWISVLQSSSEDGIATGSSVDENELSTTGRHNNNAVSNSSALLHNSQSIASLASSSCSTATTSEFLNSQHTLQQQQQQQTNQKHQQTVNELSAGIVSHLPTSKSFGGLSTTASSTTENAKNRLIMHRYIAKNSQLQSPTANKKMETDPSTVPSSSQTMATTSSSFHHHSSQAGPSRDIENGEAPTATATTPKSGRKWKKSKAAKQGSGGGSSGSSSGSQQQGAAGAPQPVLGVRIADCPTGSCEDHVPMIVQACVCVIETYGMDTVGIYRIPGNTAAVNALKESLSNRGFDSVDLSKVESLDPRWRDVNVVSSLLKMFLRKLPEPLLTDKLYPFFIDANRISTHHNRLHKLRNLLRKLPRPHYDTLRFLIVHLSEITKHSDVNKMECRNLALMFGPSIVRPSDDNMATMVTHMSDQCKIIETLIHYNLWMFDESSTTEDAVPEQHPADGQNPLEPGGYGVGVPTGVSAASFNDMHNLIRKANEDQAAAMMNEGKGQKIKNMLRRNSRRDKSKSKLKIESTAPAAVNPRGWTQPTPSNTSAASVESAFCGNYQERDIDAEIESRQTVSPQMTSGSADGASSTRLDQSPSLESSLGSLPDTSRTEPILGSSGYDDDEAKEAARRKRQEEMYSARRIFIAGAAGAAAAATTTADAEKAAIDALANHSQHLHLASSPAFEVLSEETREKIRRMQKKQSWHDTKELRSGELLKTYSPTKDLTDALSCTSDYSTTSSAPLSTNPPLAVACADQPNSSSDYASSDPSPCARNPSTSPASRPSNLAISPAQLHATSSSGQSHQPMSRSQKIRLRTKLGSRDPARRHTLSDVDTLKEGRLDKLARWFGIRKSSPDVSRDEVSDDEKNHQEAPPLPAAAPPVIVRTSPNELTPVSGDELL
ncbi:GTPase-activating protein pac-1 [Caenorhabditis elegans]|uniref:Isoform b of GTPase-activating protein pac-1 n=1 Tax=Caenorhabditis elegans TaxID=6239 RepID=P34288-2|nr:GTPase-activating protein pac-1 [Caenorhabditis elegans]ACE78177.1 PAR-6-at-contacts [Caenorhabditis elegans]CCD62881.1 GTPase-activating protein pac-1 [Caenorhabditis elegans]|eukprot:NP_001129833.1 GTPase-activating protein pac-1 [Caenorhabditis elegans]